MRTARSRKGAAKAPISGLAMAEALQSSRSEPLFEKQGFGVVTAAGSGS